MKLTVKPLGVSNLQRKATTKIVRMTLELTLESAKLDKLIQEGSELEAIQGNLDLLETMQDYVSSVYKLNQQQQEKLENLSMEELSDIVAYTMDKVMNPDGHKAKAQKQIESRKDVTPRS